MNHSNDDGPRTWDYESPPGFEEACEKYCAADFEDYEDSVDGIWAGINTLRESEKGFPNVRHSGMLPRLRNEVKETRERIIKAVIDGDLSYLAKLTDALELTEQPKPTKTAYQAAIEAFINLCFERCEKQTGGSWPKEMVPKVTLEEWPTKQEVRELAEHILEHAGAAPPSARHWPRVFKEAGLWALPHAGL
jgi:hypothetical protein